MNLKIGNFYIDHYDILHKMVSYEPKTSPWVFKSDKNKLFNKYGLSAASKNFDLIKEVTKEEHSEYFL